MQSGKIWGSSVDSIVFMQNLWWRSADLNQIIPDISVKGIRHDLSQQVLYRWTGFRWLHSINMLDPARPASPALQRAKRQCLLSINVVQKWCCAACKKSHFKDMKWIFLPLISGNLVGMTKCLESPYYLTVRAFDCLNKGNAGKLIYYILYRLTLIFI